MATIKSVLRMPHAPFVNSRKSDRLFSSLALFFFATILSFISGNASFGQDVEHIVNGEFLTPVGTNTTAPGWTITSGTPDINTRAADAESCNRFPGCKFLGEVIYSPLSTASNRNWPSIAVHGAVSESFSQTITSLVVGATYQFRYYWAFTPTNKPEGGVEDGYNSGGTHVQVAISGLSGNTDPAPPVPVFEFAFLKWYLVTRTLTATATTATINFSLSPTSVTSTYFSIDGVSLIGAAGALPVKLAEFSAASENQNAVLNWATTEEVNSDAFEIEKSLQGKSWSNIGRVASNQNAVTLNHYTYTDKNTRNGINYYRLKMVDLDGTFSYSRIQKVEITGKENGGLIFPNPASHTLYIADPAGVSEISIYSLSGLRIHHSENPKSSEIKLDGAKDGMYFVKLKDKTGIVHTEKILVSK